MDQQSVDARDEQQRKLAANRERVRRHRAKHQNPIPISAPRTLPLTSAEKVRRYRERKRQEISSTFAPTITASMVQEPRQFPSCHRTREYRKRLQSRQGNHKLAPMSDRERSRRYYAKKQQQRLKVALSIAASNIHDHYVRPQIAVSSITMKMILLQVHKAD